MENKHNTNLTSAEIAMLWNTYMADTMAYCILHHFLKTTDDKGIDPVIKFVSDIAKEHIEVIHALFIKEELPIPNGFGLLRKASWQEGISGTCTASGCSNPMSYLTEHVRSCWKKVYSSGRHTWLIQRGSSM